MRGPNLLRRLLTKSSGKFSGNSLVSSSATPGEAHLAESRPARSHAAEATTRKAVGWVFVLAGLIGVGAGGVFSSCVVADAEYCADSSKCPTAESDGGMAQLICHPTRHVCVLPPSGGICNSDKDCDDNFHTPRCEDGVCKACLVGDKSDTSCAQRADGRKLCVNATDGSGTLCVACQSNTDCREGAPICDNQACRKCSAHQDCEGTLYCDTGNQCTDSLVCIQDGDLTDKTLVGRCAQNGSGTGGKVIYVNNTVPEVKTNSGVDFTVPVFTLRGAIDAARSLPGGRQFIRMVGALTDRLGADTSTNYVIQGTTAYTFIGAPVKKLGGTTMASISGRNTLFLVTGNGALTIDQLTLVQNNSGSEGNSVTCQGGAGTIPSLVIRHSVVSGGTLPSQTMAYTAAVNITNCNTVLEGNIIGSNSFAEMTATAMVNPTAVLISDQSAANYLVENNLIAGNAGFGLDLSGAARGTGKLTFRFNTIAYNGRGQMGTSTGILCPGIPSNLFEFSRSIVFGNSMLGGSQFQQGVSCNLTDVVVGVSEMGANLGGVIKADPKLDPNFRMDAGPANAACCVDKITSTGSDNLPLFDVDGIARPQNGKWDIGASEYKKP